jgi:hypothetical protein
LLCSNIRINRAFLNRGYYTRLKKKSINDSKETYMQKRDIGTCISIARKNDGFHFDVAD